MHNNFYFLRQVSKVLDSRLKGSLISECFSQSKDELVLRFETSAEPFLIKASLLPNVSCLSFPGSFQRARKNSVDLFAEIVGRRVRGVRQFENERSFAIVFSDGYHLLFKMHGNRTNLVLFEKGRVTALFRNNLTADHNLTLDSLDRDIDWRFEHFEKHLDELKAVYFTFGKVVWNYLEERGFSVLNTADKWNAIQSLLTVLEHPAFHLTLLHGKPALSLVEVGEVQKVYDDPLEAANEYYHAFTHVYVFSREKAALLSILGSRMSAGQSYIEKNTVRLSELKHESHYRMWADLIMANLHVIATGSEKVTLENFYDDNRPVEIRLKSDLSPQKNAEIFYRKGKNQHIEIARLEDAIARKRGEMETLEEKMHVVESASDLKELRALRAEVHPEGGKPETGPLPFHEFSFGGYRILVGRNAQSNDVLTLKHSYKDDLWLHAKDVSGSHVLIKHQAGKNFPRDVIEYAASLAAGNSKRRNESLCPVIVTPKKYVRKRKGDPAGAVVVEREDVVMVVPAQL